MFDIGDVAQRLQVHRPFVGVVLQADEFDHVTAFVLDRCVNGCFAAGGGFLHIGLAGAVSRGPLGVTQFDRPRFEPEVFLDDVPQALGGARQHRMPKRVQFRLVRGDFFAGGIL